MNRKKTVVLFFVANISTSLLLAFSAGCSSNKSVHNEHEDAHNKHTEMQDDHDGYNHEGHHHASDDIILSEDKAKLAGVEVQTVSRGVFHDVIKTSGSITAASCDETTIVATVPGIVAHTQHISEGMSLSRGATIYYISSDKLQDGDQAARVRLAYLSAKREYDRTLPLLKDKIITEREFNAIRNDYDNARIAYEAISKNTTGRGVAVKAPTTGYMKECMVKDGDYVDVGTPLMVITRNQHLYLRAEVPVRYYSNLNNISSAKFRTQYSNDVFDLKQMHGQLLSLGKSAVSTSSYVPVTFQLDNHDNIVPGAYAEVFLITGERENVLSLPSTALTEDEGVFYVYVQKSSDCYRKQEVKLGATDGELTEIICGLDGGERVVTKGAINVKLAGATNAIPAHNHNH